MAMLVLRRPRALLAGVFVITGLSLAGCASSSKSASPDDVPVATINSVCPIQGDEFDRTNVDPSHAREWNGKKIGFCCSSCYKSFDRMTDAQKNEVLARAEANAAPPE